MIQLSGNYGKLLVGYKLAASIYHWQLTRKDETLAGKTAHGQGVLDDVDGLLILDSPTKISLRLDKWWWSWYNVKVVEIQPFRGGIIRFDVEGDPEVL